MKNVKNRLLFLLSFLFVGSSFVSTAKQSDKISVKGICTEITDRKSVV